MSLPRYSEYKDSGVEWLSEVPVHWPVHSLRHHLKAIFNGITSDQIDEGEGTVPVTRIETISKGVIDTEKLGYISQDDARSDKLLKQGDILFSNINSLNMIGNCAQYCDGTAIYAGMNLLVLRPVEHIDYSWLFWLIKSSLFRREVESRAKPAINQASIPQGSILSIQITTPNLSEQTAIATFLDRETGKIDGLIAEQEKLITLLAEKRQATISHAVTKGLNTDTPMKDSGVVWLGEVPEHWNVAPLSIICSLIQTGPFGSQLHAEDYIEDGTPVVNPSNLVDGQIVPDWKCSVAAEMVNSLPQHVLRIGDIVFGRRGEMGRCALVKPDNAGWLCGTGSLNLRLKTGNPKFVVTYLGTPIVRELLKLESVGSTMDNLNAGILSRIRVPQPPDVEQAAIATFLETEISRLNALTAEATHGIALLKERRSALISAAVTGKIDVREANNQ